MPAPPIGIALLVQAGLAGAPVAHIKDNSFLVEEAYNQEPGVVQHIATFARSTLTRDWRMSFTQEWPVTGERHQLSYTVNLERAGGPLAPRTGFSDLALHYRFQLAGRTDQDRVFVAPRLSTTVPIGSARRGLGAGGLGIEVALPVSVELSRALAAHFNARGALITGAGRRGIDGVPTRAFAAGASLVWAAARPVNLLVETVVEQAREVTAAGARADRTSWVVNPGLRWALDLSSDLQVVPGLAYTLNLHGARPDQGLFVYLSVEHPFASRR